MEKVARTNKAMRKRLKKLDQNLRWVGRLITVCLLPLGAVAACAGESDERETAPCCAVRCLSPAPERRSKSVRHEATCLLLTSSTKSHFILECEHASTGSSLPGQADMIYSGIRNFDPYPYLPIMQILEVCGLEMS